ncbi:MAG: lysophospholipid acyltransferase family protein [Candidatus Omnitrophota bacterium]
MINLIYFRTKFQGLEHIPSGKPFILACNHNSNLDPFVVGICRWQRFSFLAKEELFRSKISSFLFAGMGAFPIKRDTSDFRALREALRRLKRGCPLILFPEGTRGVGDRKKESQPGVGFLAQKSGVPVIPVFIQGSDKALPQGSKWFKFHPIRIIFGRPLVFTQDQKYNQISDSILQAIYSNP